MRVLLGIVAMCMALALAGCGGGESAEATTSADTAKGPKPAIPQGPTTKHLVIKDVEEGDGAIVQYGDNVAVHYVAGIYETGEEIESAWVAGQPLGLHIGDGEVLPALERGVPGMRVGGRRELIFPSTRAHTPFGSDVGDTVVYVVDVIGLEE